VYDADKAGEEGPKYIDSLKTWTRRIISIPPPAHDLTDFWKSGGDLRAWAAEHVAGVLGNVLKGLRGEGPVVERWERVLEIANRDAIEIR